MPQKKAFTLFGNFPTQSTARASSYRCTSGLTSCAPAHRIARGSAGCSSCRATDNGSLLSVTLCGDRRASCTTHRAADHSTSITT
jgi:hypothetical protein